MTEQEYLLTILAEECAEVSQRVCKALRFGLAEVQPGQGLTNRERIEEELHDLCSVARLLEQRGTLSRVYPTPVEVLEKREKIERFRVVSVAQGVLDD